MVGHRLVSAVSSLLVALFLGASPSPLIDHPRASGASPVVPPVEVVPPPAAPVDRGLQPPHAGVRGRSASSSAAAAASPRPEPEQLFPTALSAARQAAARTGPLGPALSALFLVAAGGLALVHRVRTRGPG